MRRIVVAALAASVGLSMFAALGSHPARAATNLVVNSSADSGGTCSGGTCTLRAAIAVANTAGSSPTTITFASSTNGTPIALTSGQMDITATAGNVTITGNGPGSTIIDAGGQTNRVFQVDSGATVSISQMTLQNGTLPVPIGNGGGAILINGAGTVTVNNSVFTNNNGGIQLGGAIFNFGGTLTVLNSTFDGNNRSGDGGAIGTLGALTVSNSTFTGNSASGEGGAIFSNGGESTVTVINSTIANNSVTGGGSGNGGGMTAVTGTITVTNTIVAKNTAATGANCHADGSATITDGGNNLEDGTAPGSCGFTTNAVHADPALGTLQNNGGATPTLAITKSSPAFGAASASTCAAAPINNLDQRAESRNAEFAGDTACDIGAFEVQGATTTPTPTPAPTASPTALPSPSAGSGAEIGGDTTGLVIGGIGAAMLAGLAVAVGRRRT
ncbi:MAG: hypothetical protein JOZ75_14525 [Candidatus Dormibacteraeota bacterium]|nr:hypothetical protein [Candidatus Dormibacteraeota bacterium]